MATLIREEARLIVLRTLSEETSETLNSSLLQAELLRFGISPARAREWVHAELDWLKEMGAISLMDAGTIKVATLTERGARHLDRSFAIEGIKRPSRPGD